MKKSLIVIVLIFLMIFAENFSGNGGLAFCISLQPISGNSSQNDSISFSHVYIEHPRCGDLIVDVGVGDPRKPHWSINLWDQEADPVGNLNLTIDISEATQYLPPSETNRWFLKVYDTKDGEQGQIVEFTITYHDDIHVSTCIPVPIYDLQTSLSYLPGVPLELAISRRQSIRDFPPTENYALPEVSWEHLSKVLWAGYGEASWGRTIPNICGNHSLVIYVCNKTAVYKFIPKTQSLELWKEGDYRWSSPHFWGEKWIHPAPIELFIAMDTNLCPDVYLGAMETGCAIQNIYLQANTLGLGTCCVSVDREAVKDAFDMPVNEFVLYNMPLGHPEPAAFYNFTCVARPGSPDLPQIKQSSVFLEYSLMEQYSAYDWRETPLSAQEVSQILWSAYGQSYLQDMRLSYWSFQRQHRTVPSAHGKYPLEIWMANSTGVYTYDYQNHRVYMEIEGDWRAELAEGSKTSWLATAPTIFMVIWNSTKMEDPTRVDYAYTEIGFVLQNVQLESVAWGLAADWIKITDEDAIRTILGLIEETNVHPVIVIGVGHPSKYFHKVSWVGGTHKISVFTNACITNLIFNQETKTESFKITETTESPSFFNVTIPLDLLTPPFTVLIDDTTLDFILSQNATHSSLYFTHNRNNDNVKIIGTPSIHDTISPLAKAGPDQTVNEDTITTLDGSGSSDNVAIANYTWTFIDITPQSLTGMNPTYTFRTPGVYPITLTVFDAEGNWDKDTLVITVLDTAIDTDGDGIPDVTDIDDDDDGMPDTWESENGLNPLDATDASRDSDRDGLTNLQEYRQNTDPNDFFSPIPSGIFVVALAAVITVSGIIYFIKRKKARAH